MNHTFRRTAVFVALACCATITFAQSAPATAKRQGTRDELRACLNTETELQTRRDALAEGLKKVDAAGKQVSVEGDEVKSDQERLDSDPSITGPRRDRIERKIRQHNARVAEYKQLEAKFEADKSAFDKDHAAWRDKCTTVQFLQDDMDAVKKEREAAGKK